MSKVVYKIIKHENSWAYQARGTISETFPTNEAALEAAKRAAGEQKVPGETSASNMRRPMASGMRSSIPAAIARKPPSKTTRRAGFAKPAS